MEISSKARLIEVVTLVTAEPPSPSLLRLVLVASVKTFVVDMVNSESIRQLADQARLGVE